MIKNYSRSYINQEVERDYNNWSISHLVLFVSIGYLSFFSNSYFSTYPILNLVVQILIPIAILVFLTNSIFYSFVLLTLSDIFLVNQSICLSSIGVPFARSILLFLLFLIFALKLATSKIYFSKMGLILLFYGIIFPSTLITLSLIIGNSKLSLIVQDMLWIFPLLIFFPLKHSLLRFKFKIFVPWIISISLLQFLFSLTISLSPRNIGVILYKQYSNIAADEFIISHVENVEGFLENASTSFILAYISFYFSFLVLIFKNLNYLKIFSILLLMLISVSPLVIDNLRGPLLSAVIVLLMLQILFMFSKIRSTRLVYISSLLLLFVVLGVLYINSIFPEIFRNYLEIIATSDSAIGGVRSLQQLYLMDEFKSNYLFGRGIGAGLSNGFSRSASGVDFELQYHMFLYKYGIFFFLIQFIPILWLVTRFTSLPELLRSSGYSAISMVQSAILLAVLANLIASYTNPYLKTGFLTGLIGVYLAMYRVSYSLYHSK